MSELFYNYSNTFSSTISVKFTDFLVEIKQHAHTYIQQVLSSQFVWRTNIVHVEYVVQYIFYFPIKLTATKDKISRIQRSFQ